MRGFTLIEMLIVISIVGILMAVVIPALSDKNTVSLKPELDYEELCMREVLYYRKQFDDDLTAAIDVNGNPIPCGGF